ncbi:MAG: hypothetical protein M3461_23255 [Pseudomonadota bacterium]|nr:hypothetical protein [Pseudomonadota bacterium]
MSEADQKCLLDKIEATDFNDTAIRNMLLTSGGLVAFGGGVSMAGFSALRVLALLALRGLSVTNRDRIAVTLNSFSRAKALGPVGNLDDETAKRYRDEWHALQPVVGKPGPRLDAGVIKLMAEAPQNNRLARLLFPGDGEARATAAVAALTLGDIVYSAAAIDLLSSKPPTLHAWMCWTTLWPLQTSLAGFRSCLRPHHRRDQQCEGVRRRAVRGRRARRKGTSGRVSGNLQRARLGFAGRWREVSGQVSG